MFKLRCCILSSALFASAAFYAVAETPDSGQELWKFLSTHGYGIVRCQDQRSNRMLVRAEINGKRAQMVVDTGCAKTTISHSLAEDLRLDLHETKFYTVGVGGASHEPNSVAIVQSFKLSGYEINRTNIVQVGGESLDLPHSGLLGYDFLQMNAVLLPVGADFFFFKPGAAPVPSVDQFMAAMGFRSIPLIYGVGGLRVSGMLNGHPFVAIVDCGAPLTIFDASFVFKTAGQPKGSILNYRLSAMGVDGRKIPARAFVPEALSLGPLSLLAPDIEAGTGMTLSNVKAQALIGYDLLAEHQAIIDLGHDVLWMK